MSRPCAWLTHAAAPPRLAGRRRGLLLAASEEADIEEYPFFASARLPWAGWGGAGMYMGMPNRRVYGNV